MAYRVFRAMTNLTLVEMFEGPPQLMDSRYSYAYASVRRNASSAPFAARQVVSARTHLLVLCENALPGHSLVLLPGGHIAVVARYNCEGDGAFV